MRCSAGKGAHYRSKPGARSSSTPQRRIPRGSSYQPAFGKGHRAAPCDDEMVEHLKDRKSTRLNSSHGYISYAVFCLKKKKTTHTPTTYTHALTRRPTRL